MATPVFHEDALENSSQDTKNASKPRPPVNRRRDKPQLSCNLCRRRKWRCDRRHPCSNCAPRGLNCAYPENSLGALGMHERIGQLERLVMSLAPKSAVDKPGTSTVSTSSQLEGSSEHGSMRVDALESRYVSSEHWAAILESIAELKDHFDYGEQSKLVGNHSLGLEDNGTSRTEERMARSQQSHALLLYSCPSASSREEILACLPPRSVVDRHISCYFNRLDIAPPTVHGPTFLREYEAFWSNRSVPSIVWIGLLFSMICLGVLASDVPRSVNGDPTHYKPQQSPQVDLYREKVVQCLVMGEYTNAGPYVLETMIHYLHIEFFIRTDANKDLWFLLSLAVSLALRMGYHRDPSHFPRISPFQAEMRRRIWATVLLGDILISGQMGMPRIISDWQCDTKEPRNLNDTDLIEGAADLPPARPETELTTTLGVIARRRMMSALGAISSLTAAVKPYEYEEVMRVDNILHEAAASIPPPLKTKSMAASLTDTPQTIVARMLINLMFLNGQVMLHRRYIHAESLSLTQESISYSRRACLNASIGALETQHVLNEETSPGGQLQIMSWRITSIMKHQFLTATMILCSLLYRGIALDRKEDIVTVLRKTRQIWLRNSSVSREAEKAAETIDIVLARVGDGHENKAGQGDMDDTATWEAQDMQPDVIDRSIIGFKFDEQITLQDDLDLFDSDVFLTPTFFTPPC